MIRIIHDYYFDISKNVLSRTDGFCIVSNGLRIYLKIKKPLNYSTLLKFFKIMSIYMF